MATGRHGDWTSTLRASISIHTQKTENMLGMVGVFVLPSKATLPELPK